MYLWCWESALIVKLYDIDDSSFIDNEYYPKDLVHWKSNK
ncbi:PoNe immunity protein domain-containing protein [Photobacterium sanguinicancri]